VSPLALRQREHALGVLTGERFDVLVIGGGINGAAIARDAALRGLRVALVERDDFAAGTSSRSSRLIHGGLRYLEHGFMHLVFESSRERRLLLELAPHLVRPLAFTWPVYDGARVPRWKLAAGLFLYDALSLFRNVDRHQTLDRTAALAREPGLRPEGLQGGAMYYDASTDDARLTLANALGAEAAGAVIVNHAAVRSLYRMRGELEIGIDDLVAGKRMVARARVAVNATGPWTDAIRRLEDPRAPESVRRTKGVHIAVPRARVGNRAAVTVLSPVDGRVMFILPGGAHTIVGTTDTPTTAEPENVRADEGDVAYLLRSANAFFPRAELERRDVVSAWAGIRPLIASGYGSAASSASREHSLRWSAAGVLAITGGKLTTYRSMAAEVVDAVARRLGGAPTSCSTHRVSLPGGDVRSVMQEMAEARRYLVANGGRALVDDRATPTSSAGDADNPGRWVPDPAFHLVSSHGSAWRAVWERAERDRSLAERIEPSLPYIVAEMVHGVEREHARTLADLLVRRTHIAYETTDHGRGAARRVAGVVAPLLDWGPEETTRQLEAYDAEVRRLFGVDPA
jgi:glycerol-3-phosphate dehydrogenase